MGNPAQKAERLGVPLVGVPGPAPRLDGVVGVCALCGRSIHQLEGYYCAQTACPVQPKAV